MQTDINAHRIGGKETVEECRHTDFKGKAVESKIQRETKTERETKAERDIRDTERDK